MAVPRPRADSHGRFADVHEWFLETLLHVESVDDAIELIRTSPLSIAEAAEELNAAAARLLETRPEAARSCEFLANVLNDLCRPQPWVQQERLSAGVNDVLTTASQLQGSADIVDLLAAHQHELDDVVMTAVMAWHAGLAQTGVPPSGNGLRVAVALGLVLGPPALIWSQLLIARAAEEGDPQGAWEELQQAQELVNVNGDDQMRRVVTQAVSSFQRRFGIPDEPRPGPDISQTAEGETRSAVPGNTASASDRRAFATETGGRTPIGPLDVPFLEKAAADLRDAGRFLEALAILDDTISVAAQIGHSPGLMRMLLLRGLLHDDLNYYREAEADFAEAEALAASLGDDQRRFEAITNAAASFVKRGQPRRALPLFRSILRHSEAVGASHHVIAACNNLALAYEESGDHRSALQLRKRAVALTGEDPSRESYWLAMSGLALDHDRIGNTAECREVADRLWKWWHDDGVPDALAAYFATPAVDWSRLEVYNSAEAWFARLLEQRNVLQAGFLAQHLGEVDYQAGRIAAAVARLDRFLERFEDERFEVAACLHAEVQAAQWIAADPGGRADALDRLRTSVAHVEGRLAAVLAAPSESAAADGDWIVDAARHVYDALMVLLLEEDGSPPSLQQVGEAFALYEQSRPVTLTSPLTPREDLLSTVERHDVGAGESIDRPDCPNLVRGTGMSRTVSVEQVVEALRVGVDVDGESPAAIAFVEAGAVVGAFVVDVHEDPACRWVPLRLSSRSLFDAARELSVAFNGDSNSFPPRRPTILYRHPVEMPLAEQALAALGDAFVGLEEVKTLCVVSSPSMDGIPLHAVRRADGRRLVEAAAVVYQPSLTTMVATALHPAPATASRLPSSSGPRGQTAFVAGVAAVEDAHRENFEDDTALLAAPASLPLPADGSSTKQVSRTQEMPRFEAVTGVDATPAAVLDGLRRCDVVHVAAHGFVNTVDAFGSGLLLSNGETRPSRIQHTVAVTHRKAFELTVRDIARTPLTTHLLTLRACSTARRSAISAKEEMSTLTRAFEAAGCRRVLSTLWNVDQQSSAELFRRFYSLYLYHQVPAAAALATVQRDACTAGSPFAGLYHWAPYIVSGDWR